MKEPDLELTDGYRESISFNYSRIMVQTKYQFPSRNFFRSTPPNLRRKRPSRLTLAGIRLSSCQALATHLATDTTVLVNERRQRPQAAA